MLMVRILLSTLRGIMFNNNLLKHNIERSQKAYELYRIHSNYHHALHIYHANQVIYNALNNLISNELVEKKYRDDIYNYLFHLEDWFLQFHCYENTINDPEDRFVFSALEYSIPFPLDFIRSL